MEKIALPQKPQYVKGDEYEATFEIKGCHPGYGNTLGNAMRRVLLSSLEGYAVTRVKFAGVDHEFTTIPGVKESVIEIILNIKNLRFKMHKDEPTKVKLKVNGAKKVTAANITAPSSVEVINPEAPIANLTNAKAKLEMDLWVEKGIGYLATEDREEEESKELGMIAVDALFTPIKKVNYTVENMRVGKRTDFDKLTFQIETDGSVKPEEAFKDAAKILIGQFAALGEANEAEVVKAVQEELSGDDGVEEKKATKKPKEEKKEEESKEKQVDFASIKIEDLNLPTRIAGILEENKIENLDQLREQSEEALKNLEGMGDKGIKEIKKAIGSYGLVLS